MSQIYLFTGENAYVLREERRRWTAEFVKKYGDENCVRMSGQSLSARELLDDVSIQPFLAEKRMVVIDGMPRFSADEIEMLARNIHPQVIAVFVDPKPDKRIAGTKKLLDIADVKEFKPLKGPQLRTWIASFMKQQGLAMQPKALDLLLEFVGENQDVLAQEIAKLALYAQGRTLTPDDIELMVIPTDEGVIWKISDLLASGSRDAALQYARRLLSRGGDAYGLWAILLNMLKNLVAVSAAMQSGNHSMKDIAEASGVHIFAVRSLQSHAQRINAAALASFLTWTVRADRDLKTGAYRSTDDAPQELLSLIDRFILKCP
jgi:DNA polymerase III subunit delta